MSILFSIACALIFSFFLKMGFIGGILGLIMGQYLYRMLLDSTTKQSSEPDLYLKISFEILGHLSKSKGRVTQDDIQSANAFMDRLQLNEDARRLARESFNRGKDPNYPLRDRLRQLYSSYRRQYTVLNLFCEQLIRAALNDGQVSPEEEAILWTVADELHISRARMMLYIQMMAASSHFQQQRSSGGNYYQQNGYYQQSQSYDRGPSLQDAYQVLGVKESDDNITIKRAYRKLMNEHHPDKLMSKGLPKEMLEAAKQRVQEIQAAYDLIKSQRGFK